MRRICISDIHGCLRTFRALLWDQIQLTRQDHLFLLGDYVDRGPDSKGVLDEIFRLQAAGYPVVALAGNHEDLMRDAGHDRDYLELWLANGGRETLASFGHPEKWSDLPQRYLDYLHALPDYHVVDEFILVHAGLNFALRNPLSDPFSLRWIRNWYPNLDRDWLGDRYIVHGHTPQPLAKVNAQLSTWEENRVLDIDAGCYLFGDLVALDLDSRKLYVQQNLDMTPLRSRPSAPR